MKVLSIFVIKIYILSFIKMIKLQRIQITLMGRYLRYYIIYYYDVERELTRNISGNDMPFHQHNQSYRHATLALCIMHLLLFKWGIYEIPLFFLDTHTIEISYIHTRYTYEIISTIVIILRLDKFALFQSHGITLIVFVSRC